MPFRNLILQELDADALGFKLMMYASQEGKDPIATLVGAAAPHMVFRVLERGELPGITHCSA